MADKITFSWQWYKDLQPMEWLQYIATTFLEIGEAWSECDSNYFKEHYEDCKAECPDISKKEIYSNMLDSVTEGQYHISYKDSMDIAQEINDLRENVLKAFENSVIFPNLLSAIGIIDYVLYWAEDSLDYFWSCLHYCLFSSSEEVSKICGEKAAKRFKKEVELTEDDYEEAFECLTIFLEIIEKGQFSEKLRDSAWAIRGYCKLKAKSSEKYAETEAKIAKRYEVPYEGYRYAETKIGENITDRKAYEYLKEHGIEGASEFELPKFDTWQRYLRSARRHHKTQKNTSRAGRPHGPSIIKPNQIQSISEISSQYTEEDK